MRVTNRHLSLAAVATATGDSQGALTKLERA